MPGILELIQPRLKKFRQPWLCKIISWNFGILAVINRPLDSGHLVKDPHRAGGLTANTPHFMILLLLLINIYTCARYHDFSQTNYNREFTIRKNNTLQRSFLYCNTLGNTTKQIIYTERTLQNLKFLAIKKLLEIRNWVFFFLIRMLIYLKQE